MYHLKTCAGELPRSASSNFLIRMLGSSLDIPVKKSFFGVAERGEEFWRSELQCTGREENLKDCEGREMPSCARGEVAGIICHFGSQPTTTATTTTSTTATTTTTTTTTTTAQKQSSSSVGSGQPSSGVSVSRSLVSDSLLNNSPMTQSRPSETKSKTK